MKAFFRLLGLEDKEMLTFLIKIHNTMNASAFSRVPLSERAVFVPQCLRSAKCPAHLTPEGLKCVNCGQCTVGRGPDPPRETGIPDLHHTGIVVYQKDGQEIPP